MRKRWIQIHALVPATEKENGIVQDVVSVAAREALDLIVPAIGRKIQKLVVFTFQSKMISHIVATSYEKLDIFLNLMIFCSILIPI